MADSTESETSLLLRLLAPTFITLPVGLVIHSFIIGVNVNDWWKGRSVTSIDHIVTSLGISRMCAQFSINLYLLVSTFVLSKLDSVLILVIIGRVYSFFTYTNIWLTTLLSIIFCLKISILRTRLFLYLRRMILPRTGHCIIASGLLSAFNSYMHWLMVYTHIARGGTYNTTMDNPIMDCIDVNTIYSFTIGAATPLLFYYISTILLFCSLYHHTVKMKMSSNLSINLETYYSAMKFVSFTFTYSSIYFIGHYISAFYYSLFCARSRSLYFVLDLLPVLHSSYLIYRTVKLRSRMSKVLQNLIDFLFHSKD